MRARLDLGSRGVKALAKVKPLEYRFATTTAGDAQIRFVAVPVHALTSANRVRIGVNVDDGPIEVFDYMTFGRSDEWKENVLTNTAVRGKALSQLKAGVHRVRVYAMDPGVVLDRIEVLLDGAPRYYGMPPVD